ncbi:DUF2807 domain-containing protein [Winogradskyella sp. 3972H.M.0a.05]|uniref:GIN domain-containing protein n=1 Tax=Winogradskyella sp. 3972H.M.0a.05 TaxID=2950277 RepID=UPI00339A87E3
MPKSFLIFIFCLGTLAFTNAQSKEKIKGNRDVTIKQSYIDPFEKIVVTSDFSIEIAYNEKPSVEIETDDNLHDVINYSVENGVLTFTASKRITTKKKMMITVYYTNILNSIELKDDAELRSLTSMELQNATLRTSGNSRAYLNIRTANFTFNSYDKAKSRLNLTADSTYVELSGTSKLDALINSKSMKMDLYQRSDAVIEGDTEVSTFRLDNSTTFKGKNFTSVTCDLLAEGKSSTTMTVTEGIIIDASGSSQIYLYGEPKITINKFTDTAKLQKKI